MTVQLDEPLLKQEQDEENTEVAGGISGEIEIVLGGYLIPYVYPKKLGRLFGAKTDFEWAGKGGGKKQPDLAFVSRERLPKNTFDSLPVAPDLAVEIISKTDKVFDYDEKVEEYLQAGVKLVWLINPRGKYVLVYRQGQEGPELVSTEGELDGEAVIPGFKLQVDALFENE
jgi:Uma2 family endonuclease